MAGLFGSPPAVAAAVKPPAPMPDASSPATMEANRQAQLGIMARAGRSSTILTAPENRGGTAPPYSATRLGAGS